MAEDTEPKTVAADGPPPGTYISIISQATSPDGKALAITCNNGQIYVWGADDTDDHQLWERRAFADGSYALINKAEGACIARMDPENGAQLVPYSTGMLPNPLAQWRDDTVPGDYNAINSLQDWEQKINIPGDGPYFPGQTLISYKWSGGAPNELWKQVASAAPLYALQSIAFDTAKAVIVKLQNWNPTDASATNQDYAPAEMPISATFAMETDYGFAPAAGSAAITCSYQGPMPGLDRTGAITLVTGTWNYAPSAFAQVPTTYKSYVQVPARTGVGYAINLYRAQITVPYTASFAPVKQGAAGGVVQVSGTFSATCDYAYDFIFQSSWPVA